MPNKDYRMTRSVTERLTDTASKTVNQFLLATDTSAPFNFFFSDGLRLLLTCFRELLPETCWLTENIATRICVTFQRLSLAAFPLPPTQDGRVLSTVLARVCNCTYTAASLSNRCWFLGASEQDQSSQPKVDNSDTLLTDINKKHSAK